MSAYSLIKKVFRDNKVLNPVLRSAIRFFHRRIFAIDKITHLYRIYGTVRLDISGTQFKVLALSDDNIANELYYQLGYELNEFLLLRELLITGRNFIDVGANTGMFSLYVSKIYPAIKVLSVEPHPANFSRLEKNIQLNGFTAIEPIPCALGSVPTSISFTIPSDLSISTVASANRNFGRHIHKGESVEIEVEQRTLDSLLASMALTSRDLIKIDVEYYELDVLKGADYTLRTKRPMLIIEILNYEKLVAEFPSMKDKLNRNYGDTIHEYLSSLDYTGFVIGQGRLTPIGKTQNGSSRNYLFVPGKSLNSSYTFREMAQVIGDEFGQLASVDRKRYEP